MKPILKSLSLIILLTTVATSLVFGEENPHNFAHWEPEIAAFEHADATNFPPTNAWLFIGSSTVRFWHSLPQDFPNQPVINRGFGGSAIIDSTHFAPRIIFPYAPSRVFLRAGGNDLWAGKSPAAVFADFQDFVTTVQAKLPETEIIYISQNPSLARWSQADKEKTVNQLIANFVRGKKHLHYLETYDLVLGADGKPRAELFRDDKLHFNAAGYQLLAARVREALAEIK